MSFTKRVKRKMSDPPPKPPNASLLSSSLLLLQIPADTNTTLPVWEAMMSQHVDVTWTVEPYSISVHLTPTTPKPTKTRTAQRRSAASVAQTTGLSSSVLQPQSVAQPIQQLYHFLNNTSVLLTFPQNSSQLMVCYPPPQPPVVAPGSPSCVVVPRLLILTQPWPAHQPGTSAKNEVSPPVPAPTKMQAASQTPAPSTYHTKKSSGVKICDNFLFNMCFKGTKCKKHHTPLPFHWQLWCLKNHQWVDISPQSQVLLERLYCDVRHDVVCLKDGSARYRLNFESMEFEGYSKYDSVRRLTNTEDVLENCYFPSKWKIYWWNNITWIEYDKNVSTLLLKKMAGNDSECFFYIKTQEYKLDFNKMTQINVTTGFESKVRCRPIYRSPDSMQPHLRTQIAIKSDEATSDPPGANFRVDPLEEFSSWYPPVWRLPSEDVSLVDVPVGTLAYCRVQLVFSESMPETAVDIISIQQVQNLLHWDKYQRHKAYMQKEQTRSKEPLERHLFHGTSREASQDICHNNFDPRMAGLNGTSNGFGSYFATRSSYANLYSKKKGLDEVRHMFLAKVLVGKACVGKQSYRRPPRVNSKKKCHQLYDSCVDNIINPTMFVVFDRCQCYPYYLIKYKDLPKEVDI